MRVSWTRAIHLDPAASLPRVIALCLAGALLVPGARDIARAQASSPRADQTDREHRTLDLGSAGALDLSTLSGDITVTAGTGPATLEIIRRSHARTDAQAKQALDRVTVDVAERAGRVTVRPLYPGTGGQAGADVQVSFAVTAPPATAVVARSIAGDISISGIHGEVRASTASGSVTLANVTRISEAHSVEGTVTITDAQTDGSVQADSIGGDIVLARVKARHVSASSISGKVTVDDTDCEDAVLKSLSGTIGYRGLLAPDGRYELTTQSGSVHFEPTGTPSFDLDAQSFSGMIQVDPALHFQTSAPPRRSLAGVGSKLTGTVGAGRATVVVVTFSGSVTIGKR
jgi:DUF4097 and DUF4098 domain-containing protein YvlB